MLQIMDLGASAAICPMAVLCIYLLNDRWRAGRLPRWALLAVCGPFSIWMYLALSPLPTLIRIACPWLIILLCCWLLSAIRDARFLFVATTGMLLAYLSTSVSGLLSLNTGVPAFFMCLLLDAVILLLNLFLFRPAFLDVYHVLRKGWLVFSLMPLSLAGIFFSLLTSSGFVMHYTSIYVSGSLYLLALLTLFFYGASFYFFGRLGRWQQGEVDRAVLDAQVAAYTKQNAGRSEAEERARILRHDLRHYLRMVSTCLREADQPSALRALDALETHLDGVDAHPGEEGPS